MACCWLLLLSRLSMMASAAAADGQPAFSESGRRAAAVVVYEDRGNLLFWGGRCASAAGAGWRGCSKATSVAVSSCHLRPSQDAISYSACR